MDKNALRDALLPLENQDLQAASEAHVDCLPAAKPDRTVADDAEDHSLNVSDAELADAPLLRAAQGESAGRSVQVGGDRHRSESVE